MSFPIIEPETICAQHLNPVLYENALDKCADVIKATCKNYRVYWEHSYLSCIVESILSDLNSSLDLSATSLKKISNATLGAMDGLDIFKQKKHLYPGANLPWSAYHPCDVFSALVQRFYHFIEKDSELTSIADKTSESVFSFFRDLTCEYTRCAPRREFLQAKFDQICPVRPQVSTPISHLYEFIAFNVLSLAVGVTLVHQMKLFSGRFRYIKDIAAVGFTMISINLIKG